MWNKKNYAITQELVHPDFTAHGAGGQDIKQGPNGVADLVRTWHASFPDGHMTMDDIITEGDFSVIRMTFKGTHMGDFYGVPPCGKVITATSIGIDRVIEGYQERHTTLLRALFPQRDPKIGLADLV